MEDENDIVEQNELFVEDNEETVVDNQETQEVQQDDVETINNDVQEEVAKTYTQEEVDKILDARTNSLNRKHQKDLSKYRKLEDTLKQGLGKDNIDDITNTLDSFYNEQGIQISHDVSYRDDQEEKILGQADAKSIIELGEIEMKSVANELAMKKRTPREQETFMTICSELTLREAKRELAKTGADSSVIDSPEFQRFAGRYASHIPLTEIYDDYRKINKVQKKQPQTAGSMKNVNKNTNEIKDFYSVEEARKFTTEELRKNPKLRRKIEESMQKWR